MKVAAARNFHAEYGKRAEAVYPGIEWSLFSPGEGWSASPDECEIGVLVGDAYCPEFKTRLLALPRLRWVHTENSGTDGDFYRHILDKGVLLTRSHGANTPEVAEFVFALLLHSAKQLDQFEAQQRERHWQRRELEGLAQRTLLVVGLGSIGSRVAVLAKAFGMRVLGIGRSSGLHPYADEVGTLTDLPAFIPRADAVVLAVSLNDQTRHLFADAEFQLLKEGAMLINIARGDVVDISALKKHLKQRPSLKACLDVMPQEPWPPGDTLWDYHNVLITPHTAWSGPRYRKRASELWLENLHRFREGESLLHVVTP